MLPLRIPTKHAFSATLILLGLSAPACGESAQNLRAPAGYQQAAQFDESAQASRKECPSWPEPFTASLDFPSKFEGSDAARDELNAQAAQAYRQQTADIKAMEKHVSKQIEHYMLGQSSRAADCAVNGLYRWADAQALQGKATTHTGKSVRKWALGSFASAYLQLKLDARQPLHANPQQAAAIEDWFASLGERVRGDWDTRKPGKINNHAYWAAWSAMVVAVVCDDRELFDWALDVYRIAADQIDIEGFLPNELKRETRALFYHNYALVPLSMIAAFAEANGVSLRAEKGHALSRLAHMVMRGLDDPVWFEERAGARQRMEKLEDHSKFTWLEPYCWMYPCGGLFEEKLNVMRPLHNYRVGGDVTRLFADAARLESPPAPN